MLFRSVDEAGAPIAELGAGELDASAGQRRFALPLAQRPDAGSVLGLALTAQGDVDLRVAHVRVAVR